MTITTKYGPGQKLFTLLRNRVCVVRVDTIKIEVVETYKGPLVKIEYYASEIGRFFNQKSLRYDETELFTSKEELLQTV